MASARSISKSIKSRAIYKSLLNALPTPEEELEKQYCDYKAQFEQWKIKNSDSEGSEAYIRYVKQFEEWEKDVEKRRAAVRQKAEQERMAAERDAKREAELRQKQNEEAAAKAYAEEQASYVAMHQRAMQVEQNARSRLSAGKHNLTQVSLMGYGSPSIDQTPTVRSRAQPTFGPSTIQTASQAAAPVSADNSMVTVMQQMLSFVMGTDKPKNGDVSDMNGTQVPAEVAAAQPEPATPPQLWGSDGASYPVTVMV
ncbi:TolA protein [Ditylenchus destructor]|uniref:TolA protein n=1 Tax=Ditylenchus destructor TaxID=166010 RepID=A0AAD4MSW9_9BILA|nr:TolA protein [Ditylenchus destructor]